MLFGLGSFHRSLLSSIMSKIHPKSPLGCEKNDNDLSLPYSTDPNENSILSSCPHTATVPSNVHNSGGYAKSGNNDSAALPIEVLLCQRTYAQVRIPEAEKVVRRLWHRDIFICGHPCNILTVIRLIQLLAVNLSTLILPWIMVVPNVLTEFSTWGILLALGVHSLLYVIEEITLYEFPSSRSKAQLCYAIFISILYAVFEAYFGLVSSLVYLNKYLGPIVLLFITVIFMVDHWYTRAGQMMLLATKHVEYDRVTRPETTDKQLGIGPQLVFPVPREFSMPGYP